MPFVDIIYSESQHSLENARKVGGIVHAALQEHFNVSAKVLFQQLHPVKTEYMIMDDSYMAEGTRTEKVMVIKITCVKGRTDEQKKKLYAAIASNAAKACGISDADVFILVNETERSAWSFANGKAPLI